MTGSTDLFISTFIKLFFILSPFFILSMFLSLSKNLEGNERRKVAVAYTFDIILICVILYLIGDLIFKLFGITLDAFRVGAGALLFLSSVDMVRGSGYSVEREIKGSFTVVPLAIPITVGPAVTGTLLVMGADVHTTLEKTIGCFAVTAACICLGGILLLATKIERLTGKTGLEILSKLTGLVLSALAAQIVFTGARNLLSR